MVSTVRKSQASMLAACARKKARHDECVRCGAGWRPASSSTLRTEVAETAMPRPLISPTIRLYPQCGFSRARRTIRSCQLRPRAPPAEDRQLMAQNEDLQLLRATRPFQQPHQREQVPNDEVHKRPEQAASL